MSDAEPLTNDEEAALRRRLYDYDNIPEDHPDPDAVVLDAYLEPEQFRRLLATLDLAREGIRLHAEGPGHHYSLSDCSAALEAATTSWPAAGATLDVKRLARAIMRVNPQPDYGIAIERWDLYAGTVARDLANEYARDGLVSPLADEELHNAAPWNAGGAS